MPLSIKIDCPSKHKRKRITPFVFKTTTTYPTNPLSSWYFELSSMFQCFHPSSNGWNMYTNNTTVLTFIYPSSLTLCNTINISVVLMSLKRTLGVMNPTFDPGRTRPATIWLAATPMPKNLKPRGNSYFSTIHVYKQPLFPVQTSSSVSHPVQPKRSQSPW